MKISPLDIRRQRFKKALRGYDSAEVDAFLEMLADAWEETVETREASSRELELLRARASDFDRMEGAVREVLVTQQKSAATARADARREAELIIRDAQVKGESMLNQAHRRVQVLTETIRELQDRRLALLARMKEFMESQKSMILVEENRVKAELIPDDDRLPGENPDDGPILELSDL